LHEIISVIKQSLCSGTTSSPPEVLLFAGRCCVSDTAAAQKYGGPLGRSRSVCAHVEKCHPLSSLLDRGEEDDRPVTSHASDLGVHSYMQAHVCRPCVRLSAAAELGPHRSLVCRRSSVRIARTFKPAAPHIRKHVLSALVCVRRHLLHTAGHGPVAMAGLSSDRDLIGEPHSQTQPHN